MINTDNGLATLSLSFSCPVAFTYRLKPQDGNIESKGLGRYVLQEMTDHSLTYFIRPPATGSYLLTVFAREFLDAVSPKTLITFRSVAEYKVVCDSTSDEVTSPFPYCSDSSWGLDMYASFIGARLIPTHRTAVVFCPDGHGLVSLKLSDPELRLYARLVREGLAFDILKRGVTVVKDDSQVVIRVELPEPGEYGLEVFVNDPDKDGKLFAHFCQYLFTTDMEGSFASVYKDLHEVEASESPYFEETATAENQSDNVESVEEVQAVICAKPNTETVILNEQAEQEISEEQQDDQTDKEKIENVQQAEDEIPEVTKGVYTQQIPADEPGTPADQQLVGKPGDIQECLEKGQVDEQAVSEEPQGPEVAEEVITAAEQTEAETVPTSEPEPEDRVVVEELAKDQPEDDQQAEDEVPEVAEEVSIQQTPAEAPAADTTTDQQPGDDQESLGKVEVNKQAMSEEIPRSEIAEEVIAAVEQTEAETGPPSEPKGPVVAEELVKDEPENDQQAEDEVLEVAEGDSIQQTPADSSDTETDQHIVGKPGDNQECVEKVGLDEQADELGPEIAEEVIALTDQTKAESVPTGKPEDHAVAEEPAKDEPDTDEVKTDELAEAVMEENVETQQSEAETVSESAEEPKTDILLTEQTKAETVRTGKPEDHAVAEEPAKDEPGTDEAKTDEELSEVVTEENVETQQSEAETVSEAAEEPRTDVALMEQTKAETVPTGKPEDHAVAEEPAKDETGTDEVKTDEELAEVVTEENVEIQKSEAETVSESAEEPKTEQASIEEERQESTSELAAEVPDRTEQVVGTSELESKQTAEVQECLEETENVEQADTVETTDVETEVQHAETTITTDVPAEPPADDKECLEEVEHDHQEASEDLTKVSVENEKAETAKISATTAEPTAEEPEEEEASTKDTRNDQQTSSEELPEATPETSVESQKAEAVETSETADRRVADTEQVAGQDVKNDQQPSSEESAEVTAVTVETEMVEPLETNAASEQEITPETKDDQEKADEQMHEEPKEDQPCSKQMKSDEERTLEESTEVVTELTAEIQLTGTVEVGAVEDQEPGTEEPMTDQVREDEQTLEEQKEDQKEDMVNDQKLTSDELAEVVTEVPVETEKADNVEHCEPADQQVDDESKKDEKGEECLEKAESGQQEELPEVALEASVESQEGGSGEISAVDGEQVYEQPDKDVGKVEDEEEADEQKDEEPRDRDQDQISIEVVKGSQTLAAEDVSKEAQPKLNAEDHQASARTDETSDEAVKDEISPEEAGELEPAASEQLPQVSAEVSVKSQESDADEMKTDHQQDEKAASDDTTVADEVAGKETELDESDNVITGASEDDTAAEEPAPKEQEHGPEEETSVEDSEDHKIDLDKTQPEHDSSVEECIGSSVTVVEHSVPPGDTNVCQEHSPDQHLKASETEVVDTSPAEVTEDMHVSAVNLFTYLPLPSVI